MAKTAATDFQTIVSSNLDGARYDAKSRTCDVKFKSGAIFRYKKVMPSLWKKFAALFDGKKGSPGSFFAKEIRGLANEKIEA